MTTIKTEKTNYNLCIMQIHVPNIMQKSDKEHFIISNIMVQ